MKRENPIVAIDGPVGAGKSTVAARLARSLGFEYINTGAMYRAVALAARAAGIGAADADAERRLGSMLAGVRIDFAGGRIALDGRDVTDSIGEPEIGELASQLSALGVVRDRMRDLQRAAGVRGKVVMEGRDIGTAVFPDAEIKFFLDASAEVRAGRRFRELRARGVETTSEEVLARLIERDRRDSGRQLAPLRPAADAIIVDSSALSIDEVVTLMAERVRKHCDAA